MKSLWGDLSIIQEIKTPQEILNEQASFLNSSTEGVVLGKLVKIKKTAFEEQFGGHRDDGNFKFEFLLTSPKIVGYRYTAFRIEHSISIYPVAFYIEESITKEIEYPLNEDEEIVANNEKEFINILEDILSSKAIIRVISSLINLSKSL